MMQGNVSASEADTEVMAPIAARNMHKIQLRPALSQYMATVVFLLSYFGTVALGNLIYATPWGNWLLSSAGINSNIRQFPTSFTLGFWLLLLMPLIVAPVAVPLLRPVMSKWLVGPAVAAASDFRKADLFVLMLAGQVFVAWAMWRSGAFGVDATDALQSIEARFALQGQMSFLEKVALHSLLPFLTLYAVMAALRTQEWAWAAIGAWGTLFCTVMLLATNMKWPALIFFAGIVAAVSMFSRRLPYLKAIIGAVALVVFYLVISSYVFRWVPPPSEEMSAPTASGAPAATERVNEIAAITGALATNSAQNAPFLLSHAINRMALPYVYYYEIFTTQGQVCGTLWTQFTPGAKPCVPTYRVYSTIFPNDGFEGRGSAPAAPHITAYALNGWPGAALGMIGICVLLAAFAAVPLSAGLTASSLAVLGAITGYHLSQIPGEGVIYYDHGILWPLLLILAYSFLRWMLHRVARRRRWLE